jgi:hypothetical protein
MESLPRGQKFLLYYWFVGFLEDEGVLFLRNIRNYIRDFTAARVSKIF